MEREAKADGSRAFELLTPEMERRLSSLRFPMAQFMDGRLTGVHRSAQPGISVEYADHREYAPGDDIRHLDWKACARSEKFHVRQFTRDTHAVVYIVLDTSASMRFGSEALTKLQFAARVVSSLAYLFLRQNDAVGLLTTRGGELTGFTPARSHPSHLLTVRETIGEVLRTDASAGSPEGPTSLVEPLVYLLNKRLGHSGVIVVSDFFVDPGALFPYLAYLRARNNFCWLVQVLDPSEYDLREGPAFSDRTFPYDGMMFFRCPENGQGIMMDSKLARPGYVGRFRDYLSDLRRRSSEIRVEYEACNTDGDAVEFILRHLSERR